MGSILHTIIRQATLLLTLLALSQFGHASYDSDLKKLGIKKIEIAVYEGEYLSADGKGFIHDLATLIYSPLNIPLHYNYSTYQENILEVATKAAHVVFGVSNRLDEFGIHWMDFNFSNYPVFTENVWLICRLGLPCNKEAVGDLSQYRYGEIKGYGYAKFYKIQTAVTPIFGLKHGLEMMQKKQLDYMFNDINGHGLVYMEELNLTGKYNYSLYSTIITYGAFSKNASGEFLRDYYDKRVEILLQTGEIQALYKHYDTSKAWSLPLPKMMQEFAEPSSKGVGDK